MLLVGQLCLGYQSKVILEKRVPNKIITICYKLNLQPNITTEILASGPGFTIMHPQQRFFLYN